MRWGDLPHCVTEATSLYTVLHCAYYSVSYREMKVISDVQLVYAEMVFRK